MTPQDTKILGVSYINNWQLQTLHCLQQTTILLSC